MKETTKIQWPPKTVLIDGKEYDVSGVDANGFLIIDHPVEYNPNMIQAVATIMVQVPW